MDLLTQMDNIRVESESLKGNPDSIVGTAFIRQKGWF